MNHPGFRPERQCMPRAVHEEHDTGLAPASIHLIPAELGATEALPEPGQVPALRSRVTGPDTSAAALQSHGQRDFRGGRENTYKRPATPRSSAGATGACRPGGRPQCKASVRARRSAASPRPERLAWALVKGFKFSLSLSLSAVASKKGLAAPGNT